MPRSASSRATVASSSLPPGNNWETELSGTALAAATCLIPAPARPDLLKRSSVARITRVLDARGSIALKTYMERGLCCQHIADDALPLNLLSPIPFLPQTHGKIGSRRKMRL